ncbi:MAG: 50S ribosomal protein L3 N(5)-glutamine methyltransferase [Magnetococcales bacterium]|nr:50S ribosomal protein L3 N(5)-glutamine methyltransferase [Magnetococcales bacterium]
MAVKKSTSKSARSRPISLGRLIQRAASRLRRSGLCHANGMQDPYAEAEYLVCYALSVPFETVEVCHDLMVTREDQDAVAEVLDVRIHQRRPAPYITREAFFAGRRYYVDERVLIPRSCIENLFDDAEGFTPWVDPGRVRRILDLCTGSGCLAVALAEAFPQALVDASDISADALEVARINRDHLGFGGRIRLVHADLFQNLDPGCYDLIVTNPPYVPQAIFEALPREYRHEPAVALQGGDDGLRLVSAILDQAPDYLAPGGLLVCEVGDDVEEIMKTRWPDLPVEWIFFHFGASGAFVIGRDVLAAWRDRDVQK